MTGANLGITQMDWGPTLKLLQGWEQLMVLLKIIMIHPIPTNTIQKSGADPVYPTWGPPTLLGVLMSNTIGRSTCPHGAPHFSPLTIYFAPSFFTLPSHFTPSLFTLPSHCVSSIFTPPLHFALSLFSCQSLYILTSLASPFTLHPYFSPPLSFTPPPSHFPLALFPSPVTLPLHFSPLPSHFALSLFTLPSHFALSLFTLPSHFALSLFTLPSHFALSLFTPPLSVVDPGFPVWGAPTSDTGTFQQKYMQK